ncbi:MAG: hypothetical protein ACK5PW_17305 [Burkholderiales bacterium]
MAGKLPRPLVAARPPLARCAPRPHGAGPKPAATIRGIGASVTAKPQTRTVTQREVVHVDGRPGQRRGYTKHGRDD